MPVCEILLLIYFRRLQEIIIVEFKQIKLKKSADRKIMTIPIIVQVGNSAGFVNPAELFRTGAGVFFSDLLKIQNIYNYEILSCKS